MIRLEHVLKLNENREMYSADIKRMLDLIVDKQAFIKSIESEIESYLSAIEAAENARNSIDMELNDAGISIGERVVAEEPSCSREVEIEANEETPPSKPEIEDDLLTKFLKENGAYDEFMEMRGKVDYAWNKGLSNKHLLAEHNACAIGNSFSWSDGESGHSYWNDLDTKFKEYYEQNK